jgi:hypothetical protein
MALLQTAGATSQPCNRASNQSDACGRADSSLQLRSPAKEHILYKTNWEFRWALNCNAEGGELNLGYYAVFRLGGR